MTSDTLAERILSILAERDLSAREVSLQAGLSADTLGKILNGKNKSLRGDNLSAVARVLGVSEAWLNSGIDYSANASQHEAEGGLRYGGIVEAGAFRFNDSTDQDSDYRIIPLSPDPRFPLHSQYAFKVEGDSMNLIHIEPGMWVQAVDVGAWQRLHGEPRDGALVICERLRNGVSERELTVKQMRIYRDRIELQPRSSNPQHKPYVLPNMPADDFTDTYRILAIVLSATWLFTFQE